VKALSGVSYISVDDDEESEEVIQQAEKKLKGPRDKERAASKGVFEQPESSVSGNKPRWNLIQIF